jgi:hypothetical protein
MKKISCAMFLVSRGVPITITESLRLRRTAVRDYPFCCTVAPAVRG